MADGVEVKNGGAGTPPPVSPKRERSPSFPYVSLGKAVERTAQLHERAKRYDMLVSDAATIWGMAPKSSSNLMTVGALLSFGLIEDSGTGDTRKIKVTDTGARILGDMRPGVREKLLAKAALKPKLIAEYFALWGYERPDTRICLSELKYEKGFNDEAAARFLRVYDDTIALARTASRDSVDDSKEDVEPPPDVRETAPVNAKVGDRIQWTNNGVNQFRLPATVVEVSDDGRWLWVDGSQTGIPMDQVEIVQAAEPPPPPPSAPPMRPFAQQGGGSLAATEREWIRGPLSRDTSYRLIVSGDLGPKEIGKLIKLLQAQKAVLSDDDDEEGAD